MHARKNFWIAQKKKKSSLRINQEQFMTRSLLGVLLILAQYINQENTHSLKFLKLESTILDQIITTVINNYLASTRYCPNVYMWIIQIT